MKRFQSSAPDVLFSLNGSRFITQAKKLTEPAPPLDIFFVNILRRREMLQ